MVRPTGDQVVYIDLSEPDTVIVFEEEKGMSGLQTIADGIESIFVSITEYFR